MSRTLRQYDAARRFAVALGQDPLEPRGDFRVPSKTRGDQGYEMVMVDGVAVHQGEPCLGAFFRGPTSCWHSKQYSAVKGDEMTSLVTTQPHALPVVREFSQEDIDTLKATICAGASDSEMHLFIATARHTGLDPFMKQIHCVMRSVKEDNVWVKRMTIQVGIDGYRLTADRTGKYQGSSEGQWTYDGETWVDIPREDAIPLAARIAVYRKGVERPIIGFARWSAYVQKTSTGEPSAVWRQRGPEQLVKCAEVQALRKAFPADMAGLELQTSFGDPEPELDAYEQAEAALLDTKRPEQIAWEQTATYQEAKAEVERVTEAAYRELEDPQEAPAHAPGAEAVAAGLPPPPTPPAASPDAAAAVRAEVKALLEACKADWSAKDYIELGEELSIFMPGGEGRFALSQLDAERGAACLEYIRRRRGEPDLT